MGGNHVGHHRLTYMPELKKVKALAAAYGIDLNAVEITERILAWDADANRRRAYFSKSSQHTSKLSATQTPQTSFEFGARTEWPIHNREQK